MVEWCPRGWLRISAPAHGFRACSGVCESPLRRMLCFSMRSALTSIAHQHLSLCHQRSLGICSCSSHFGSGGSAFSLSNGMGSKGRVRAVELGRFMTPSE